MSKITRKNRRATVVPESNIAAGEVQNFRQELLNLINEKKTQIEVNLENVDIIDSSGIGVFISTQNSLKKLNGNLKVTNVSPDIVKMLKIM
jgi:anti-sigma B factor antagonist